MEYEVQGPRPRGRPKRTWREVVREDCQARKVSKEDAVDHCKWRKMIKDVRWSGWVWVGECFFLVPAYPGCPGQKPLNGCVCVKRRTFSTSPSHHKHPFPFWGLTAQISVCYWYWPTQVVPEKGPLNGWMCVVLLVWACAAKIRWWLGEEMYGVWSRGSKTKRKTKEDLERGCTRGLLSTLNEAGGCHWSL